MKNVMIRDNKLLQKLLGLPRYVKRVIALSVDVSMCVFTVWLAFSLRFEEFVALSESVFLAMTVSIFIALPIFVISGLYRAIFRYSGLSAMLAVSRAIFIYGILYATTVMIINTWNIPFTVGLIQPLLLFFVVGGSRALVRYFLGSINQSQIQVSSLPKVLVYGAGHAGRQLTSAIESSFEMRMAGFLDDDDRLHGNLLNGQPIFSPNELKNLIQHKNVTHVLLAIPSLSRRRRNEIIQEMSKYQVVVRTLPSVQDLAEGRVTTSDLRDLDIDDLLGREVVEPNNILLIKNISSKVVLVTGAGGSIGGEICRQIIKLKPKKILLVEISEYALYSIHSELEAIREKLNEGDNSVLVPILASVTDQNRIEEIIKIWRPNTIYHTAAYKHVPLVEHNLAEGIKNNVIGTLKTAEVAIYYGVSDFVLISTDKAVRPTNVMGASKRLAEICLQALFEQQKKQKLKKNFSSVKVDNNQKNETSINSKLCMVRFGNVLDSSGSVIPRFKKQIKEGGPITLTHPNITRYFMTITEAAQLVIQAGAMSKGGDVFLLDMGKPIKIYDLARRMIELSGLLVRDEQCPDGDIDIIVTGLRPGEKLFEELLLGDNPQPTMHSKIQRANELFVSWDKIQEDINELNAALVKNNIKRILFLLKKLVKDYQPNIDVVDWTYKEQMKIRKGND